MRVRGRRVPIYLYADREDVDAVLTENDSQRVQTRQFVRLHIGRLTFRYGTDDCHRYVALSAGPLRIGWHDPI